MIKKDIFSSRLKQLRNAHMLLCTQLANILNLKSKGSIGNLESRKAIPSTDILVSIANLFGVSLDWLTGRSDTPYTNETLVKLVIRLPFVIDFY